MLLNNWKGKVRRVVLVSAAACICSLGAFHAEALAHDLVPSGLPEEAGLLVDGRMEEGVGQALTASISIVQDMLGNAIDATGANHESVDGSAYAIITDDGELVFFRSFESYTGWSNQAAAIDIAGNSYTGTLFAGIEDLYSIAYERDVPWNSYRSSIRSVRVADGQIVKPVNCRWWFSKLPNIEVIDLAGFDTSAVTNMGSMFYNSGSGLTSLDVSGFDTSNVTSMTWMFAGCTGISSLDLSGFDTSKVQNMSWMFYEDTSLHELDVSSFDTSSVTTMDRMFQKCMMLESLDLSSFRTGSVTTMICMFSDCQMLADLRIASFDTSSVVDFSNMFQRCYALTSLDLSHFETSNATKFQRMFDSCSSLTSLDISSFDTSKASTLAYMYDKCDNLSLVKLGVNYTFSGNGTWGTNSNVALPSPPYTDGIHNGRWAYKVSNSNLQYTPLALRDVYKGSTMAGTYVWAISAHRVSFDANGGSGNMNAALVNLGESFAVPSCEYSYEGRRFASWNTRQDGSGEQRFVGDDYVPTQDEVLFAQWEDVQITLVITDGVTLELAPDGGLTVQGETISFENRGNVDVRVTGVLPEPASGMTISANPSQMGEYDVWLALESGASVKLSQLLVDSLADVADPRDWTIPQGSTLRLVDIQGEAGPIEFDSGSSSVQAGTVTWAFSAV